MPGTGHFGRFRHIRRMPASGVIPGSAGFLKQGFMRILLRHNESTP